MMEKLSTGLSHALQARAEVQRLLASLDASGADGSPDDAARDAVRREYEQRLHLAETDLAAAREAIHGRRQEVVQEIESLQREQSVLDVRHKVGELDSKQFQNANALLRKRIEGLERQTVALEELSRAESASDAGKYGAGAQGVVSGSEKPPRVPAAGRSTESVQRPLSSSGSRVAGWAQKLTQGRLPYLISGALVAVGAIAIVLLFAQAGDEGPGPSDASGESAPPNASEFDEMPEEKPSDAAPSAAFVGTGFEVPVEVLGAPGVGSLHLEMTYDANAVVVSGVRSGNVPGDSMFEYADTPGSVAIGIVCPDGLVGDLEVAYVTFEVLSPESQAGQSPLTYNNVVAHGSESLLQIVTEVTSGSVSFVDMSVVAPAVSFS